MNPATIDIVKDAETLSDEARDRLDEYLRSFLEPQFRHDKDDEPNAIVCPSCKGHIYSGGIMDALMSGFQWEIVHGEGFCSECGWPIRMYHFVKLDGDEEKRLVFPLAFRQFRDDEMTDEVDPVQTEQKRD